MNEVRAKEKKLSAVKKRGRGREKHRVLFVCIGNACRSPMAEAIARHEAADVMEVASAGIYPMGTLPEPTRSTLLANGYSVEGLESKGLRGMASQDFDLVVDMSGYANPPALGIFERVETWPVDDPYGGDQAEYQRVFEIIRGRVANLAAQLRMDRE